MERKGKKEPFSIYRSLAGMACQNIPRKPNGKMTQAALALSGTVVLDRAHSKLESIFPSLGVFGEAMAKGRTGKGQGGGE